MKGSNLTFFERNLRVGITLLLGNWPILKTAVEMGWNSNSNQNEKFKNLNCDEEVMMMCIDDLYQYILGKSNINSFIRL